MRIRKRSAAATSSEKPELHASSNGGPHLHAIFKCSPSFQDPRSSLISPASIMKQDHLLLEASGYGATHIRPSQKQLPAEAVSLKRKLSTVVSSGVESCVDDKVLTMKKGEGNPRAKSVMDVQHNEVKHTHILVDGDDNHVKGMYMKGCKELKTIGEGDKLSEACKIVRLNAACKGSAVHDGINMHTDPAMEDGRCKVRPLQLILSSSDYSPTASAKLPLPLCPTSSSSTMPSTPPPLPRKFDKASSCALMKTPPLPSPAGGYLMKQILDVKPRDEMRLIRNENASSCSRSSSDASLVENRAQFESCGPVSSWQGHRRPRSLPISTKMIGSLVAAGSLAAKRAATTLTSTYAHVPPAALPAAASEHELMQRLDSMRCRRKDGRRWRCKAQVVKAGAPFCQYHTIKMREKHAASVVRKLAKRLQGEVKTNSSHADGSSTKRVNKRRSVRSSSPSRKAVQDGYGRGCEVAAVDEHEEEEEEQLEEEEDKNQNEQQKMLAGKLQLQQSVTSKRRWRKKCKPSIRRLHDIHDRARPATTDGLDLDTSNLNKEDSARVRSRSPLPECLLNTDPYEWRSDFP